MKNLEPKQKKTAAKKPKKRAKTGKAAPPAEKRAPELRQEATKTIEAVPEQGQPEENIQIIGQFIAARTMATGGIRVSIDIPETLVKDCAIASTLALQRQWAKITVEDYEQKETPEGKKRKPGSPIN